MFIVFFWTDFRHGPFTRTSAKYLTSSALELSAGIMMMMRDAILGNNYLQRRKKCSMPLLLPWLFYTYSLWFEIGYCCVRSGPSNYCRLEHLCRQKRLTDLKMLFLSYYLACVARKGKLFCVESSSSSMKHFLFLLNMQCTRIFCSLKSRCKFCTQRG